MTCMCKFYDHVAVAVLGERPGSPPSCLILQKKGLKGQKYFLMSNIFTGPCPLFSYIPPPPTLKIESGVTIVYQPINIARRYQVLISEVKGVKCN